MGGLHAPRRAGASWTGCSRARATCAETDRPATWSVLLRLVHHLEHRPVAVALRGEETFLTDVWLVAQDPQPVSPAEPMQLTVVAGNVDSDQQEWLPLLLASGADDFQGVRFSA